MYSTEEVNCKIYDMTKTMESGLVTKATLYIGKKICKYLVGVAQRHLYNQSQKTIDPAIVATAGDITKYHSFTTLDYSIKVLSNNLPKSYSKYVKILQDSLNMIIGHKELFKRGYALHNGVITILYSVWVQALFDGTSLLIADELTLREKHGKNYTPSKVVTNSISFSRMEKLNRKFASGKGVKMLKNLINMSEGKTITKEAVLPILVGITGGIGAIIATFVIVRDLLFLFYIKRTQVSEYLRLQSAYLKEHEAEIKHNKDFSNTQKNEIIVAQREWQDRLLNWAEIIQVEDIRVNREVKAKIAASDNELNKEFSSTSNITNNMDKLNEIDDGINFL